MSRNEFEIPPLAKRLAGVPIWLEKADTARLLADTTRTSGAAADRITGSPCEPFEFIASDIMRVAAGSILILTRSFRLISLNRGERKRRPLNSEGRDERQRPSYYAPEDWLDR